MIQSMTGFATKTWLLKTNDGVRANILLNIKSFNSRFFEATCKLPAALSFLETEIILLLKKKLIRGHIYITIQMDNPYLFKGNIQPALNMVDGYLNAIEQIQTRYNLAKTPPSLEQILRLPDLFCVEEHGVNEETASIILKEIDLLVTAVIKTRNEEGIMLQKDIMQRLVMMKQEIIHIQEESQRLIDQQKEKIQKTMSEQMVDDIPATEMRKTNLHIALDKMDIHEEIVRFNSHLYNIEAQINNTDLEKGKRIDFTLQELAREANTMSAKCSDALICKHVINLKVEIEKTREQIQNIV